jgi:hypothetical protein
MNNKPIELYLIGGATGLLSGALMLISSCLVTFRLQTASLGTPDLRLVGVTHGLSVVSLILIVPTVVALFVLLNTVVTARSFLGLGFAMIWIIIEMVGHLSQTAPLRALNELYQNQPAHAISLYQVSEEFWEALLLTGTFFAGLTALCYGLALIGGWNRLSGYLFLLTIPAFPTGLLIPGVGVQLHVFLRGLAFLIVAGILIKIAMAQEE